LLSLLRDKELPQILLISKNENFIIIFFNENFSSSLTEITFLVVAVMMVLSPIAE